MKKVIYALILPLVVVGGLVFASRESKNETSKTKKAAEANMVFRSADGGETWQNIREGLPENLRIDTMRGISIMANDKGLFVRLGKELYHSTPNATAPFWTKEISTGQDSSIATGKPGRLYWSANLKTTNGTSVWSPIFETLDRPGVRTAFETAGGAILISTDKGIFKTVNSGETWKQVYDGNTVGHFAELDGVLLSTNIRSIIRSTDNGENWAVVSSDRSEVLDVKQIGHGFAAMTYTSESNPRGLLTSSDGGKTWQPNNAGNKVLIDSIWRTWNDRPQVKVFSSSVIQVGENIYFTHRDGIYRSSDKGKTWKLLLPSVADYAFSLLISGNVIYALHSRGWGC